MGYKVDFTAVYRLHRKRIGCMKQRVFFEKLIVAQLFKILCSVCGPLCTNRCEVGHNFRKDEQCTYNLTLMRFCATFAAMEKQ